ncbi:MAG: hypothetical protein LUM44_17875 [Pyrinomonadaceae bacterium]|nr:hypothetical protein [Pyrinomonadaceae bacterium]
MSKTLNLETAIINLDEIILITEERSDDKNKPHSVTVHRKDGDRTLVTLPPGKELKDCALSIC